LYEKIRFGNFRKNGAEVMPGFLMTHKLHWDTSILLPKARIAVLPEMRPHKPNKLFQDNRLHQVMRIMICFEKRMQEE